MGTEAPVHEDRLMYTDIHSHIIWGVDDGAERMEDTFHMLREAKQDDIDSIICTPHMYPGELRFDYERFENHFREAEEYIKDHDLGIKLYRGAEVYYTPNTVRLLQEGKVYTLADTNLVLIEFMPDAGEKQITVATQKIASAGYIPVLAHTERYRALRKIQQVEQLKTQFNAQIQVNARTLTARFPLMRRAYMNKLIREGLVDYLATDTHAFAGRKTCLSAGMEALNHRYGEEVYEHIKQNSENIVKKFN